MKPHPHPRFAGALPLLTAIMLAPVIGHAAFFTWDGGSLVDSNWSTAANWSPDGAPPNDGSADLFFTGNVRLTPVISVGWSVRSITFNNFGGANPFTIGGAQTILLGSGGITNNDFDAQTFNDLLSIGTGVTTSINANSGALGFVSPITLSNSTSVLNATGSVTINSNVTGTGTLKANGGTLTLGGAGDNRSYDLALNGGTVNLTHAGTATVNSTGSISVNSGTLNINSDLMLDNAQLTRGIGAGLNIAGGRTLTVRNGGDVVVSNDYDLTNGTLTLQNSGSTLSSTGRTQVLSGATLNVTSGASFTPTGSFNVGLSGAAATVIVDSATVTLAAPGMNSYWGSSGSTANLTFRNGASGSFGAIDVAQGTTAGTTGNVSVESAATLQTGDLTLASAAGNTTATVTVTGAGSAITQTGISTLMIGSTATGAANLNLASSGTFSTGTGNITVNESGHINLTGGTLNANGNVVVEGQLAHTSGGFNLAAGKTLTVQDGGSATFVGTRGFSNTLTVTGAASLFSATGFLSLYGNTVTASSGGRINSDAGIKVGLTANSLVNVDGAGSAFGVTGAGTLDLGDASWSGTLNFSNGATGSLGTITTALGLGGSSATLNIQSGAAVTANNILANSSAATTTAILVTGAGSTLSQSAGSYLSLGGTSSSIATLTVSNNGHFTSGTGNSLVQKTGTIQITGGTYQSNGNLTLDGGKLNSNANGIFGLAAGRTLSIQNDGDAVFNGYQNFNTAATVNVSGSGSTMSATAGLAFNGGSTTNILAGGNVFSDYFQIGTNYNGTVIVDGTGSAFNITTDGSSFIGNFGYTGSLTFRNGSSGTMRTTYIAETSNTGSTGILVVDSGANVTTDNLVVADFTAAVTGTIAVSGSGSTLTQNGSSTLKLGAASASTGTLTVASGGIFTSGTWLTTIGATGTVNINGGTYNANGNVVLNGQLAHTSGGFNLATGKSLTIQNGGDALFTGGQLFSHANSISVSGTGSTLSTAGGELGVQGGSSASVTAGGALTTQSLSIATVALTGGGSVTIAGSSGTLGDVSIGASGMTGSLTFSNNSAGAIHSLGLGDSLSYGSIGTLAIQSGAHVTVDDMLIAPNEIGSAGLVSLDGISSTLTQNGYSSFVLGASSASTGVLTVSDGATFTSGAGLGTIHKTGTIQISAATYNSNGSMSLDGGQLDVDATSSFTLAAGQGLTVQQGGQAGFGADLWAFSDGNTLTVSDAGSTFAVDGLFGLRDSDVLVQAGGTISVGSLTASAYSGHGSHSLIVEGVGSSLTTHSAEASRLTPQGGSTTLTFRNGSSGSLGSLQVLDTASSSNSHATLAVESGAHLVIGTLGVGDRSPMFFLTDLQATVAVSGAGTTLTQTGASGATVGYNAFTTGLFSVTNGGSYTSGTGDFILNPTGTLHIDGGTLNLNGGVVLNGGTVDFTSGALNLVADFTVGDGGLLGDAPEFTAAKQFATTGTTTIDPFKTLTIDGGRFSTGDLVNNGGVLDFRSGSLAITGDGGITIGGSGTFGSLITIDSDSTLEVMHTATVQSGANLILDGGCFQADGSLSNQSGGRITLRNGAGRITGGGAVANAGLLTGDGIMAATFNNNAGGEVRGENGKTLVFTGATGANAGRVNLQGGTVEFSQTFTNSSVGTLQGRGTIHFDGDLTNQGAMNFSAGTTDLCGNITMTGGTGGNARLLSSGGGTVTVYDNFDHHGAEVRTSTGCNTVFFGTVTGPGPYTGTGTVYQEGTFSPGASPATVTFAGNLVCGGGLLTLMELGGTVRGSQYDAIQVAGGLILNGTLSVSLVNGFHPAAGNTFDLFDWGTSVAGTFSSLDLPDLTSGLAWDISDLCTTGALEVRSTTPPAPTNLSASPQPGLSVRLQWQDTTPPATGFEVQRALDTGFSSGLYSVTLSAGQTSYDDADRSPQTTYYYRVRALGSPDPSGFSTPVAALTPTRIADWRWVHFGNPDPVGDGEDLNDPDHDGVANLIEYCCNLDPRVPDRVTLPTGGDAGLPAISLPSDGHLRIIFLRRTASSLPTVTQGVVFSSDLVHWNAEPSAATTVETIDPLWERVTLTDPTAAGVRRFARTVAATP